MKRALTARDFLHKKYRLFDFEGEWLEAFGNPERCGVWFVYAKQGNGKTTFMLKLAKYLSGFGKVAFNSLEEGSSHTLQDAIKRVGIAESDKNILFVEGANYAELDERMSKQRSADIWIIDTVQYLDMAKTQYFELKQKHPDKLLIFVSHIRKNEEPDGAVAIAIMRDASLKIYINNYVAFSKGRYIGKKGRYIIWQDKAMLAFGDAIL